jgi:tRNA modification GTPase
MFQSLDDTIIAISTPPGVGAIAVIRLSGPLSIELTDMYFKGKNLLKADSHTLHFGTIHAKDGYTLDEVVVGLFKKPHSYTKEDIVEISCHGSSFIQQQILKLFLDEGVRLASPGEFTMRAFLNGRMDLSQAEAVADLIAAESVSTHQIAMNHIKGGFSDELMKMREELIHFASLIELELDFSEEDVEFANRDQLIALLNKVLLTINQMIHSFELGNAIKKGVNTVIAGRPNAGKSTLLNALLNEERAIVSEIAGTTRDTIEEILTLDGIQFRLIDTAGIREAQDQIEAIGVKKTYEKASKASILIYVFDVIQCSPQDVEKDLQSLNHPIDKTLVIANKMDLNPYTKPEQFVSAHLPLQNIITASAIHKMNIPHLMHRLTDLVKSGFVSVGSIIISNTRHLESLTGAKDSLEQAVSNIQSGVTGDFIAMDIRNALHHIGTITGQIGVDDLLDNIFSKFCIGK